MKAFKCAELLRLLFVGKVHTRLLLGSVIYRDDLPEFGILEDVVILQDEKLFFVQCMDIEYFESHILTDILKYRSAREVVRYCQLFSKWYRGSNTNKSKETCRLQTHMDGNSTLP